MFALFALAELILGGTLIAIVIAPIAAVLFTFIWAIGIHLFPDVVDDGSGLGCAFIILGIIGIWLLI